jgi:hypothetical protein
MEFINVFFSALEDSKGNETTYVMANIKAEQNLLQKIGYRLYEKRSLLGIDRVALEYSNEEIKGLPCPPK